MLRAAERLFLFSAVLVAKTLADCSLDLEGIKGEYPPLLLKNRAFAFPTSDGQEKNRILSFKEGEELEVYCHGSSYSQKKMNMSIAAGIAGPAFNLTCSSGKFYSAETEINVGSLTCNLRQEPRLVRTQEQCSPIGADGTTNNINNLWLIQIGWQINDTFIEQIRICHDESIYSTIWTNHTIYGASINSRDVDAGRPSFRIDNSRLKRFYTWGTSTKLNKLYSKRAQAITVNKLLATGNKINGNVLIETSRRGTNYFAKGHLAPDAAFIFDVLQDATYYFFNVAPQFQSFNNGNWKALEMNTRELASKLGRDVSVYTGTHGILEYPDKNNNLTQIFLYNSDNGEKYVPAPLYYWKVLYDQESDTSAAFIGLNDPHATAPPQQLCTNVCSGMDWVDWNISELDAGYMYCCSVEEARKAIPSIPDIKTDGLIQQSSTGLIGEHKCDAGPCSCSCSQTDGKYTCHCKCNGIDV